jgi:opacity protein-like surface antigen
MLRDVQFDLWRRRLMKITLLGILFPLAAACAASAQAPATAARRFDLQAGGGFTLANSDYYPQKFKGGALYAVLDFTPHFGAEFDFHQVDSPFDPRYERTYELAGRYHRTYGRFSPYAKAGYGRGVLNYLYETENPVTGAVTSTTVLGSLAYNEFLAGGGVDYRLLRFLNVRADYEYETWRGFSSTGGLTPQLLTIGVAYHFPGGLAKGRRFK